MNNWKLEVLRLVRTKRWLVLFVPFVFFGFVGPLLAYFLPDIIGSTNSNITIIAEAALPVDGFTNYISNAMQIGLLVAVIVGSSSLAIDANPGLSVFYRTRAGFHPSSLILPRYVVVTVATIIAFILGTLTAWYETTVLIGSVAWSDVVISGLLISLFFAFAMAVVAFSTMLVKSVKASVGLAFAVLLIMPALSIFSAISDWLPSELIGSMDSLMRGTSSVGDYAEATVVTLILIPLLLWGAVVRFKAREV